MLVSVLFVHSLAIAQVLLLPPVTGPAIPNDYIGRAIAVDGDLAAVGHPKYGHGWFDAHGACLVFEKIDGTWQRVQVVSPPQVSEGEKFCEAVALSGDDLLIGAPGGSAGPSPKYEHGSVYVYTRNAAGSYEFVQRLAPPEGSDGAYFGQHLIAQENLLVVLHYGGGANFRGKLYFYRRDGGGLWSEKSSFEMDGILTGVGEFALDADGEDVALSRENSTPAAVVLRQATPNQWEVFAEVIGDSIFDSTYLGASVAYKANRLAIGAPNYFSPAGTRDGAVLMATFAGDGTVVETSVLENPDERGSFSVSLAWDGDDLLVGAETEGTASAGLVYQFDCQNACVLTDSLAAPYWSIAGQFGHKIAVGEGHLLIGADNYHTEAGPSVGAAFVLARSGTRQWIEPQRLDGGDAQFRAFLGSSATLQGGLILLGMPGDNFDWRDRVGALAAFQLNQDQSTWVGLLQPDWVTPGSFFGTAASSFGAEVMVGHVGYGTDTTSRSGAIHHFRKTGSTEWQHLGRLLPSDPVDDLGFGSEVLVANKTMFATAPLRPVSDIYSAGAVYIFEADSQGQWQESAVIQGLTHGFGDALAFFEGVLYVGDRSRDGGRGAVDLFTRQSPDEWQLVDTLVPPVLDGEPRFGNGTALIEGRLLVGAPSYDAPGQPSIGRVYQYERGPGGSWVLTNHIDPPVMETYLRYGTTICATRKRLFVGAVRGISTPGSIFEYALDPNGGWQLLGEHQLDDSFESFDLGYGLFCGPHAAVAGAVDAHDPTGLRDVGVALLFGDPRKGFADSME